MTSPSKPLWLVAAPAIFLALWSGGYPVAKAALAYSEPMTLLSMRYGLVLLIMLPLYFVLKPALPTNKMDYLHLAVVGVLIQAVYFGMCWLAFRSGVAAGTVALFMSLQPVLVLLAAPKFTGSTISNRHWIGLVLGLIGAVVVITARSSIETPSMIGLVWTILGLLGITTATLWEKRFGVTHHPVVANLIGYAAGFVCVLPLAFLLETRVVEWGWQLSAALFYLVVGNSVIAIGLLLAMIRAGDVSSVSALFYLVPPLAAFIAWLVLGEVMPPIAWGGMAIAAVGVFIATRKPSGSDPKPD